MTSTRLITLVSNYFQDSPFLKKAELVKAIRKDFPDWSEATIDIRISELKKTGLINSPSRGVYSITEKVPYQPQISSQLKKLYNTLNKEFPYARFCVWDTKWLNEFMRHQPFHFYSVAEVEKDVLKSAFHRLSESYPKIFLDPDEAMFERYVSMVEYPLIVKQLVSESPTEQIQKVSVPKIEKLLVDMLTDESLFAAQQSEIEFIYLSVFEKYAMNQAMMKRYAKRRNREVELLKVLDKTLAKNK
jgi:predicted transcriptional regulator